MAKFASKCSRFHESNWKSSILFYQDKLHLDKNHQVIQSDQSLNLQKGHLTTPKGSQRLARQVRCDERCSFWASQLPSWYDPIRTYLSNTLDVLPRKVLKVVLNIQGRQHLHLDSFPEISWRSSPPSKLLDPKKKNALENPGIFGVFRGVFSGETNNIFSPKKKLRENWTHQTKNIPPPPVNEFMTPRIQCFHESVDELLDPSTIQVVTGGGNHHLFSVLLHRGYDPSD